MNDGYILGFMDDGEHGEGAKLSGTVEHKNLANVSVFFEGVYRGVHLGEKDSYIA